MSTLLILLANVLSIITNADICISREPEISSNYRFLGNYQLKTDSNGATYYEKDQVFCDTEPEYLYLKDDRWTVSPVLNGEDSYIQCPTTNHATPDLCPAESWYNGNNDSPDTNLAVTDTACPVEDSTPTLGCEYILLQETGNAGGNLHDGLYTKIVGEDNLYEKNGYYLQYSKLLQAWIIKNIDVRQSCDNLQYNFYSTDANIGGLNLGDENIEFDMSFPLQTSGPEGDYSCKKPKISCLNSQPSDETLNDALCNYPCDIEIPSLSCNYIQIDRSGGNYGYDGIYTKVDDEDNLYSYNDEYFFNYYIQDGYYAITANNDINLCSNTGISYYLRSDNSGIGDLENGESIVTEVDYPEEEGVTFTFSCLAQPPTASPVPAAPDGLCVAAATGVTFNAGIPLTDMAGTYVLMDGDINGSPAYELTGCAGKSSYISIDPTYPYYFLGLDKDDPVGSGKWIMYCSNTASINGDISQCVWSNNGVYFEVTAGGGCPCGQALGSNANAIPMIETGDIVREIPNGVVVVPSTDTKPITIWSQFVDVLHQETISIALVCVLVMMMVWTIVMCADLFGCKRSNKNYSAVKVVDDI